MTGLRNYHGFSGAMQEALDLLGLDVVMRVTGRSRTQLYAYADELNDQAIPMECALVLDMELQRAGFKPVFLPIYASHLEACAAPELPWGVDEALRHLNAAVGVLNITHHEATDIKSPAGRDLSFNELVKLSKSLKGVQEAVDTKHRAVDTAIAEHKALRRVK